MIIITSIQKIAKSSDIAICHVIPFQLISRNFDLLNLPFF